MNDIVKKGQVLSIIVYVIYGIAIIVGVNVGKGGWDSFAAAAVFFWIVTTIAMMSIRLTELRHSFAYNALYIMSVCVFAVLMQLCFTSIFVVFIVFAILWLTVITFLDRRCFRFTVFVQACCILFLVQYCFSCLFSAAHWHPA